MKLGDYAYQIRDKETHNVVYVTHDLDFAIGCCTDSDYVSEYRIVHIAQ